MIFEPRAISTTKNAKSTKKRLEKVGTARRAVRAVRILQASLVRLARPRRGYNPGLQHPPVRGESRHKAKKVDFGPKTGLWMPKTRAKMPYSRPISPPKPSREAREVRKRDFQREILKKWASVGIRRAGRLEAGKMRGARGENYKL